MDCKYCKVKCQKAGRQKNGQQKFYCKICKKFQQQSYRYTACKGLIKDSITRLVCESVGIRGIARVLKIAVSTVMRLIKSIAGSLSRPVIPQNKRCLEMDEVRTYIGKKENQYWIAYALCSETKRVIDFTVGKRSRQTLQKVVDILLLSGTKTIKTDKLNIYQSLIPSSRHIANAYNINHIERNNLNLRTHLKRLSRRTICFSKSHIMLDACLRIYFWHDQPSTETVLLG